ncbi:MAG TPA: hypothetical protein VGA38_04925 [Candidatus Limnocylindria bacterium]
MRKALPLFGDVRPASTGLATAFFRFYLLDALSSAPARPASLLARVAAEKLPFATGAFGRALQSLLEGGHLVPARDGLVALTALGAAERMVERERWTAVMPSVMRLLGDVAPRPAPAIAEPFMPIYRAKVADAYQERVLVAYVRDRVASAREGGRPFCVALVAIGIDHQNEATRRAMVHRTIRASLGGATTLFGGDVTAFRYGDEGIAIVAPCGNDPQREARLTTLARARVDELVRSMSSSVRAFHGATWHVHAGAATWTSEIGTTGALLRAAEDALGADGETTTAA